MKRLITILFLFLFISEAQAVRKEQSLEQTLSVLRAELTERYQELCSQAELRKLQTKDIIQQLRETIKRSNQN